MTDISVRDAFVSVKDLVVNFGKTKALRSAGIHIAHGEVHALIGNHGEGKTTLCRVLAGLLAPEAGEINVDGKRFNSISLHQATRLGIEFTNNSISLFPHLSVGENISIGRCRNLRSYWFSPRRNVEQVASWLRDIGANIPVDTPLSELHPEDFQFILVLSRLYCRPRLLILDETLELLPASLFANCMAVIDRCVSEGMSVLWVTHQLESAIKHADTISILRYGSVLSSEPAGATDIKDLVRRTYIDGLGESGQGNFYELLKNTEAVLRDLPVAIVIVSHQGKLQYVNNEGERFFIGGKTASFGQDIAMLIGAQNEEILAELTRVVNGKSETRTRIFPLIAASGNCLVSVQTCLVGDRDEDLGVMLVMQDVSEQERMRQQLILDHNLSSIGLLAAGVAHEVNNPLEVLGNYLRFLKKNPKSQRAEELFSEMQEEVNHIQKIIGNLMSFSGRTSENRNKVDLHALASELCSLLDLSTATEQIRITCREPEQPTVIEADPGEIRQILLNLIRNSIEALPTGGDIDLSVSRDADHVWLTISDNGAGIQFEPINDIFLPFSSTKVNSGNNQGLGLSIVKGLVEKYHGTISVRNLDKGCEFAISFPECGEAGLD